jgi:Transglycosylase SLT domain
MTRVTYTFVSMALVFSLQAGFSTAVSAKDRQPDPIENPGECPIDAPVRVASLDSLRHFEGLIGHCPETAVIESRAWEATRPRAVRDQNANDAVEIPAWQIPLESTSEETGLTIAANDRAQTPGKKRAPLRAVTGTRALVSRDGTQVAIVPAAGQFHDAPDAAGLAHGDRPAGTSDEIEAVLALRPRSYATTFDQNIANAARTHGVDPLLLHAVIKQESGYRASATSHAGARGLMQVMPATGRGLGVRDAGQLYDPKTNIETGARLLSQLWRNFDGNIDLVLAAYNAGEGAVRKYGNAVPPYRETQDYVVKVKTNYRKLAAESGLAVNF